MNYSPRERAAQYQVAARHAAALDSLHYQQYGEGGHASDRRADQPADGVASAVAEEGTLPPETLGRGVPGPKVAEPEPPLQAHELLERLAKDAEGRGRRATRRVAIAVAASLTGWPVHRLATATRGEIRQHVASGLRSGLLSESVSRPVLRYLKSGRADGPAWRRLSGGGALGAQSVAKILERAGGGARVVRLSVLQGPPAREANGRFKSRVA